MFPTDLQSPVCSSRCPVSSCERRWRCVCIETRRMVGGTHSDRRKIPEDKNIGTFRSLPSSTTTQPKSHVCSADSHSIALLMKKSLSVICFHCILIHSNSAYSLSAMTCHVIPDRCRRCRIYFRLNRGRSLGNGVQSILRGICSTWLPWRPACRRRRYSNACRGCDRASPIDSCRPGILSRIDTRTWRRRE